MLVYLYLLLSTINFFAQLPQIPYLSPMQKTLVAPQSEARLQAELFQWFWNTYPELRGCFFHVPNGGSRSKAEAARLKAVGVVAGVPDMVLALGGRAWFFELKAANGYLSPKQVALHVRYRRAGNRVFLIRSFEVGKRLIEIILNSIQK